MSTAYERDVEAMLLVIRPSVQSVDATTQLVERIAKIVRRPNDAQSHEDCYLTFAALWGFPALLRVLATAITQESK